MVCDKKYPNLGIPSMIIMEMEINRGKDSLSKKSGTSPFYFYTLSQEFVLPLSCLIPAFSRSEDSGIARCLT
jgi:hypothetical protein